MQVHAHRPAQPAAQTEYQCGDCQQQPGRRIQPDNGGGCITDGSDYGEGDASPGGDAAHYSHPAASVLGETGFRPWFHHSYHPFYH